MLYFICPWYILCVQASLEASRERSSEGKEDDCCFVMDDVEAVPEQEAPAAIEEIISENTSIAPAQAPPPPQNAVHISSYSIHITT